jgi:hypothetical protein
MLKAFKQAAIGAALMLLAGAAPPAPNAQTGQQPGRLDDISGIIAAAQPAEAPTARTEILGLNVPDEFDVGRKASEESSQIMELVVPPETAETWSRRVTVMMVYNAADRGLEPFYEAWRDSLRSACPGLTDTLVKGSVDSRPALRGTLSCPEHPKTGKPENVVAFLVQGEVNMMWAQVAFRRPLDAADTFLVDSVAASLKVCDQRTFTACTARKASGFVPA